MSAKNIAVEWLKKEEGWRDKPYYCTSNFPTIGYGLVIGERYAPLPDITMTLSEGEKQLTDRVDKIIYSLQINADTRTMWRGANFERQAVMISMVYQLGLYGLLKFKKFIAAMNDKNYTKAAGELVGSLAYRQTPARWKRQAEIITTGKLP